MKHNEAITSAVEAYTGLIIEAVKTFRHDMSVDVDIVPCESTDKEEANSIMITTPIGVVIVMPNFAKKEAFACIFNLGELSRLQKEGFDDEFIEKEGRIYGDMLPMSKKNAEKFAYYLTHKIDYRNVKKIN